MEALEKSGSISENTFSLMLSSRDQESLIDFGKPQGSRFKDYNNVEIINMLDDFFWSANCQGFAIGDIKNGYRWGTIAGASKTVNNGQVYSIFDSGASALIFPKEYFKRFLSAMFAQMADNEYEVNEGYVLTRCYSDFPTLFFMFDNKWVTIEPHEYLVDISESQDRSICVLLMSQGSTELFVFGLPLFQDYYAIHDNTNNRIGFGPHINSDKGPLVHGSQPTRVFKSDNPEPRRENGWSYIACAVFTAMIVALWVVLVVETVQSKTREDRQENENVYPYDGEDEDEMSSDTKKYMWTMIVLGVLVCTGCGFLIFIYLQPIVNRWFTRDPDAVAKSSYTSAPESMVSSDGLLSATNLAYLCVVVVLLKVFVPRRSAIAAKTK